MFSKLTANVQQTPPCPFDMPFKQLINFSQISKVLANRRMAYMMADHPTLTQSFWFYAVACICRGAETINFNVLAMNTVNTVIIEILTYELKIVILVFANLKKMKSKKFHDVNVIIAILSHSHFSQYILNFKKSSGLNPWTHTPYDPFNIKIILWKNHFVHKKVIILLLLCQYSLFFHNKVLPKNFSSPALISFRIFWWIHVHLSWLKKL